MKSTDQSLENDASDSSARPLEGLRVVDLTDHRGDIGPWILGELGADVIKVEPPGGCATRHSNPLKKPFYNFSVGPASPTLKFLKKTL